MIPLKLYAAIGGYFGPSSRIEWDGDNLYYLFNPSAHAGEPGTEKTPVKVTESDWKKFHDSLDKIGVWNWKERYEDPSMLDGTSWLFEAVYKDNSIISSGSNSFPKRFNELLEAIRKLTKEHDFQ
jgi:hypothetical protein